MSFLIHDFSHLGNDHSIHDLNHLDNNHSSQAHFSKNGDMTGISQHNLFGGKNYWDSHGAMKGFTMKNIFGGHDYYNQHGDHIGLTMPLHGNNNFLSNDGHFQHSPSFLHSGEINSARIGLLNNIR